MDHALRAKPSSAYFPRCMYINSRWTSLYIQFLPLERYRSRVFYRTSGNAAPLLIAVVANPVGGIFSKRLQFPLFIGFVRIVIAAFCPYAFKQNWIGYRKSEKMRQLQLSVHVCSRCSLPCVSCRRLLRLAKRCSLCCGVCCCRRLLCCSRWISILRSVVAPEEFSPAGICVHFLNVELLCLLFRVSCI